jgi:hypothetical protein
MPISAFGLLGVYLGGVDLCVYIGGVDLCV